MKSSSQSTSHRKPVGGIRSVRLSAADNIVEVVFGADATTYNQLTFADDKAVMECSIVEDSSLFEERFSFDGGTVAVQHRLAVVANRNLAEAWLEPEFQQECVRRGLCAEVVLNDGRQLLVGYSERFGAEQPLRVVDIKTSSGRSLSDGATITLTLESFDTTASAIYANN